MRTVKLDKKLDKVGASTVTKHSKAYWLPRVFRPVVDGAQIDNYCARMSCGGVQRSLSLRTPNGEEAAQIARDWFVCLSTNDWEACDAKYRSTATTTITPTPGSVKSYGVTIGDFLSAARNESDLAHKTFDAYA